MDSYVCDNNNMGKESIKDIVNNKHVTILNYKNIVGVQPKAYTECFLQYRSLYDWMIFIDIDEYIMLDKKYKDIKEFINDPILRNADIIRLCWKLYSGGQNLEANGDYRVVKRFTESIEHKENCFGKSIINTSIKYVGDKIYGHGYFANKNLNVVNAIGDPALNKWSMASETPIHQNAWINHYPTKTIGEYIDQKYFRGGPNNNASRYSNLDFFFKYNFKNMELLQILYIIIVVVDYPYLF